MRMFEDWHFIVNDVPFTIRKVGSRTRDIGWFVLFERGRFKFRGTKDRCVARAKYIGAKQ